MELLNTYSGFLAVFALFLAIPLSILANLLTPALRKWYARRSLKAAQRRVSYLDRQIAVADRLCSDTSYAIACFALASARAVLGLVVEVLACIAIFSLTILININLKPEPLPTLYAKFVAFPTGIAILTIYVVVVFTGATLFNNWCWKGFQTLTRISGMVMRHDRFCTDAKDEINKLKSHLETAEQHLRAL
jgi:hypothetical protein